MPKPGFTFGGVESSTYDIVFKSVDRTMLPATRKREIVIPGKHGTYDFYGGTLENRLIDVEIKYIGSSLNNLRTNARSIAAWLETLSAVKTLQFDDETDKYYNARVFSNIGLSNLFLLGETTIQFECEPFAYSDEENTALYTYDSGYEYDTGLLYVNNTEFDWYYTTHNFGLYNNATYKTPVTITITGQVTNIAIENIHTGESCTISATLSATDILIIDSENFTCELNGVNNMSGFDGDFINFGAGNNTLKFTGGSPTAVVTLDWTYRWL